MKAVVIARPEGPAGLELREVPEPAPGPFEIAVAVRASALNRADLLQMRGRYPAPVGAPADIPGLEYAGEVVEAGPHVQRYRPGDRVMGLVGGGAFAERVVVHEREALAIPEALSFEQAAAIPEAFFTAYDALVRQGGLRSGEAVLIHAATSGVGTAAVQIVRAVGASAIATGRTPAKLERLARELSPSACLTVAGAPSFAGEVRHLTGGAGADLVLELVGGAWLPESIEAMAPRGRLVLVGLLAGRRAEVDLGLVLTKRLRIFGTVLRSRPIEERIAVAQAAERHLSPLFAEGRLRPVVDEVLGMAEVREAAERLAANASYGNLVLRW